MAGNIVSEGGNNPSIADLVQANDNNGDLIVGGYGSSGGYSTTTPPGAETQLRNVVDFECYFKEIKVPLGLTHHRIILDGSYYDHYCRCINNSNIIDEYYLIDENGLEQGGDEGQYLIHPNKNGGYYVDKYDSELGTNVIEYIANTNIGQITYWTASSSFESPKETNSLPTHSANFADNINPTTNAGEFDLDCGAIEFSHDVKNYFNRARNKKFLIGADTFYLSKGFVTEQCLHENIT